MIAPRDSSTSSIDREESPHTYPRHHRRTGSGQYTPSTYVGAGSRHHSRRSSAFFEVGLGGDDQIIDAKIRKNSRPYQQVRFRSKVDIHEAHPTQWPQDIPEYLVRQPRAPTAPFLFSTLPRLMLMACIFLLGVQSWNDVGIFKAGVSPIGAEAGPIQPAAERDVLSLPARAEKRANSPTDICFRWSGQSAVVNGTLYYYGGRSSQSTQQTDNTWSMENAFLSLQDTC